MRTPLRFAWLGLLTACSSAAPDTTLFSGATSGASSEPGTSFPTSDAATGTPTSTDGTGAPTGTGTTGGTNASSSTASSGTASTGDASTADASSGDASTTDASTTGTDTIASSGGASTTGTDTTASGSSTGGAVCGDGIVEGDEQCDDGNADETDACTAACKAPSCMDGQKNGGETGVDCGGPGCVACPMVLLLGGNATKMLGARYDGFAWTPVDIAAPAVDPVDIAITSDGVGVGVFRYTKIGDPKDQQLQHVLFKNGAWTAPLAIGPTLTRAAPTLSAAGKGAHAVFQGVDFQFYYAGFSGAVWGPTAEKIGSFGPGPGSVTTLGADAAYVFHDGGQNNSIYSRVRNPVWQAQQLIDTQASFNEPPVVVALGAVAELLEVHTLNANDQVRFSVRKAGVWGATANLVGATTPSPPALAALPGGKVILAMRGADNRIYTSTYDPGVNLWSGLAVVNVNPISDRTPAVTAGIPGAEVELVYLDLATKAPRHVRLNKGSWSAPAVAGPTALEHVAITSGP